MAKKYIDKRDWEVYNKKLVKRGEFYMNPRFLDSWLDEVKMINVGKVGQPYLYPPSMIEFGAVLHAKRFDYRAIEGILRALSKNTCNFPVICFSQIRRRINQMDVNFLPKSASLVVGIDGSGMKSSTRGEWLRQKYAIRRGWIKVILMGDVEGNIVDVIVGNEHLSEQNHARKLITKHRKHVQKVLLDGLHDSKKTFQTCKKTRVIPVIKIRKNARPKGLGPRAKAVREYQITTHKKWVKKTGYGYRWPATEGIFSSTKRIFGEEVTSHHKRNQYHEAKIKFWAYQKIRDNT
jgi:hypothetical protein